MMNDGKNYKFHTFDLASHPLTGLNDARQIRDRAGYIGSPSPVWVYKANTIADFVQAISYIRDRFSMVSDKMIPIEKKLWFRGHSRRRYVLLPSVYRQYHRYLENHPSSNVSLPQYQRALLERFLFKSRRAVELNHFDHLQGNSQVEYLAEMQHYSVPSNLLDWSENPFVSLFFACSSENSSIGPYFSVFVLNPHLYNLVRTNIISYFHFSYYHFLASRSPGSLDQSVKAWKRTVGSCKMIGNTVPNFGAHYNRESESFSDYILGPVDFPCMKTGGTLPKSPLDLAPAQFQYDKAYPMLPLAIIVPRTAIRQNAQLGTFVAFNLSVSPCADSALYSDDLPEVRLDETDRFYHYQFADLQVLQSFYLANDGIKGIVDKCSGRKMPFLYRIDMPSAQCKYFENFLRSINVIESSFYPELYRVGETIANDLVL